MPSVLAEFTDEVTLIAAARRLREAGHVGIETYAPIPIEGLDEALDRQRPRIPAAVLVAGLVGGSLGYLVQWWTVHDWPLRVSSFPLTPIPAFMPITFESTILVAAITAFVAVFIGARLLHWWHPFDEIDGFARASVDRFFLAVPIPSTSTDDHAFAERCRDDLAAFAPLRVVVVDGRP